MEYFRNEDSNIDFMVRNRARGRCAAQQGRLLLENRAPPSACSDSLGRT